MESNPVWSRDGRELYYRSGSQFLVVDVTTEPTFEVSVPVLLFDEVDYTGSAFLGAFRNWDVHPDGSRFLMVRQGGGGVGGGQGGGGSGGGVVGSSGSASAFNEVYLVTNWFEELRQRMGN